MTVESETKWHIDYFKTSEYNYEAVDHKEEPATFIKASNQHDLFEVSLMQDPGKNELNFKWPRDPNNKHRGYSMIAT